MLDASSISYKVGSATLLHPVNLRFAPGEFCVIMGPNGAGKSTLLQLLAGELKPATGTISWEGRDIAAWSRLQWARRRAVLSQQYALQFPVTVREVVRLGRYPHQGVLPVAAEEALIDECLSALQMSAFADRDYGTLSGGEAQKVQMSRVLAQLGGRESTGNLLLLDEPVSHLDMRYQHLLLQTAKDLSNRGNTVIAVLHDINLALRFADRMLFIKEGRAVLDLHEPESVTADNISAVFDVSARILHDEAGRPVVVF
jgi:iron complex transport system ATP-binding protein